MKSLNKIALSVLSLTLLVPAVQATESNNSALAEYMTKTQKSARVIQRAWRASQARKTSTWYNRAWQGAKSGATKLKNSSKAAASATATYVQENQGTIAKGAAVTAVSLLGAYLTKKAWDKYSGSKAKEANFKNTVRNARRLAKLGKEDSLALAFTYHDSNECEVVKARLERENKPFGDIKARLESEEYLKERRNVIYACLCSSLSESESEEQKELYNKVSDSIINAVIEKPEVLTLEKELFASFDENQVELYNELVEVVNALNEVTENK